MNSKSRWREFKKTGLDERAFPKDTYGTQSKI
jgi:hypothetical protein